MWSNVSHPITGYEIMDEFTKFILTTDDDLIPRGCELTINNIVLKKFLEGDTDGIKAVNIQLAMALREVLKDDSAT
jgi:hypothetical protein